MVGHVQSIHIATESGGEPKAVTEVEAIAGAGLRGDRYFRDAGTFTDRKGSDLTLITAEAVAAVERDAGITLEPGSHRRNITTTGVSLTDLVGERFTVGTAVCLGTEPCEPCSYLERHVGKEGLHDALLDRGGLRCQILSSGHIRVGAKITTDETAVETDGQNCLER